MKKLITLLLGLLFIYGCVCESKVIVGLTDGRIISISGDSFREDESFIVVLRNGWVVESFSYDEVEAIWISGGDK